MTIQIIIFISIITIFFVVKFLIDRSKDFDDIIQGTLQRKGLKLIKSEYPGLFKIGPFSNEEKEYQSKNISDNLRRKKIYFRKLTLESKSGEITIWVKITVGENCDLDFIPSLKDLN